MLEMLGWMDPQIIADVIAIEHPQVGAVIISALTADMAADAVAALFDIEEPGDEPKS